jgi:hypothetical protein
LVHSPHASTTGPIGPTEVEIGPEVAAATPRTYGALPAVAFVDVAAPPAELVADDEPAALAAEDDDPDFELDPQAASATAHTAATPTTLTRVARIFFLSFASAVSDRPPLWARPNGE